MNSKLTALLESLERSRARIEKEENSAENVVRKLKKWDFSKVKMDIT